MAKQKEGLKKDVGLLLKSRANSSDAPRTKGGVPMISGLESKADQLAGLYDAFKQAEAEFRALEGEVLVETDSLYEKRAQDGQFSKSLNLEGNKTNGIQVTYQNKFVSIPSENEGELKTILGEKFNTYFEQKRDLKLQVTDDKTIQLLIDKLGEKVFFEIFSIDVSIVPKGDMDRNQFNLPEQARAFLKQYKASVKKR